MKQHKSGARLPDLHRLAFLWWSKFDTPASSNSLPLHLRLMTAAAGLVDKLPAL